MNARKALELIREMNGSPTNVKFTDLQKVCEHFFGSPRTTGGSHHIYKTPWPGDPRINIQNKNGKAKKYQVEQVLRAVDKLINEGWEL